MYTFTDLHLAISEKLGWGDMLAEVALPAIDRIISHFLGQIADATGDVLPMCAAEALVVYPKWTPDDIFGLLCPDELSSVRCVSGFDPHFPYEMFVGLRGEIEEYMRRGMDYQTAIAEWFK